MPNKAKYYIYGIVGAGAVALVLTLAGGLHVANAVAFAIYFGLAVAASLVKMKLPGMEGTYSLNALFVLFGLYYLSPAETMVAACAAIATQCYWRAAKKPMLVQVLFNLANIVLSIGLAYSLTNTQFFRNTESYRTALMAAAAFVQFAVSTLLVSGVLSLLQGKPLKEVWEPWYQWSFPYYLIGVALVGLLPVHGNTPRPEGWLLLLPLLYLVHFFYSLSLSTGTQRAQTERGTDGHGELPTAARRYVGAILSAGALVLGKALLGFDVESPLRFLGYLGLGLLVSTWKVRLPGMLATVSIGFVVTLFAIAELPFSQAVIMGGVLCAMQVLWKPKERTTALQTAFSVASLMISTALAHWLVRGTLLPVELTGPVPGMLAIAATVLFAVNTATVSAAVCLAARRPLSKIWQGCCFWVFPYYLAGACASAVMVFTSRAAGWLPSTLILPLVGMVYSPTGNMYARLRNAVSGSGRWRGTQMRPRTKATRSTSELSLAQIAPERS